MMVEDLSGNTFSGRTTVDSLSSSAIELAKIKPVYADILLSTSKTFPELGILAATKFDVTRDTNTGTEHLVGTFNKSQEQFLDVDLESGIPGEIKDRYNFRLGMPLQVDSDEIYRYFLFTRQLALAIQDDTRFEEVFGDKPEKPGRHARFDTFHDFVNSDQELFADYVTASVMGNFGAVKILGVQSPDVPPAQWRAWGSERMMTPAGETRPITVFKNK